VISLGRAMVKVRQWLTTSNRRLFKLVHSVDPSTFTDKAVSLLHLVVQVVVLILQSSMHCCPT
jgi:hypothetical protein